MVCIVPSGWGVRAIPYSRPTLTALRNQAIEDVTTSGVPGLDGLLRNAVLRVLAWVMAGLAYSVYGYLDWIAQMAVPFTARDEFLEAWAALIGIFRKDATPASGSAGFTAMAGTVIPAGTALTRKDATPYTSTADATADEFGVLTVPIVAAVDGALTDADPGIPIGFDTPIAGVSNDGSILPPGLTGGADQETDPALRTRMLAKYRAPPQGGSISDYQSWALEVPGCTRVWIQPDGLGPGTIIVRPMFDDAQAAHGGFPQGTDGVATEEHRWAVKATGDQLNVAEHIWPVQPVTALVYVAAPSPLPIDMTIVDLIPNTVDMTDAILASLQDQFLVMAEAGGIIYPSDLYAAVQATPGIEHFTITDPALPIQAAPGQLPVVGALTIE